MAHTVLVSGAGGFVGANLCRRLLGDGHDVGPDAVVLVGEHGPRPPETVDDLVDVQEAAVLLGERRDLGPRGITVNTVQPGPVDTDMNPAQGPFAESLKSLMALGRYGRGDEIAGLVAYLASPEAG